jgi:hypothetical protein
MVTMNPKLLKQCYTEGEKPIGFWHITDINKLTLFLQKPHAHIHSLLHDSSLHDSGPLEHASLSDGKLRLLEEICFVESLATEHLSCIVMAPSN